jgi:ABC-type phosphate transport system substrate-binding protein
MVKQISRNKAAIGYETLFMLKVHKDHGTVKALSIDGHHPADHDYALAGKYPFYRTYSLTTWSEGKKQLSEELIQYLMTYVEENYREFGFIPASQLRRAGWKFRKNELVGKPEVVAGN